jgi:hypothetical protein
MEMEKATIGPNMNAQTLGPSWSGIRDVTAAVLEDFRRLGAKQLNLRLNESDSEDKRPVFIDWVAVKSVSDQLARKSGINVITWGEFRLGDTVPSRVYEEALDGVGRKIIERDWSEGNFKEKRVESKLLVQKAGLMYQRFIALIGGDENARRSVGLLSLAFESKPNKKQIDAIDAKMKQWASWPGFPKSELVRFAEDHFAVGGPFLKQRQRTR